MLGSAPCEAQQISVSSSVDPASVSVGESAELTVAIQGAQEPDQPPAIQVEGAQVQYIGPTKQASLNNFQLSVSMTHRYLLVPTQPGELTIPAVSLDIRGQRYETKPIILKVANSPQDESKQAPAPGPLVECEIPRRPVYVGESFPVQVRLLVPSETPWRIERLPQFETDAFTKSPFQQPQQQRQNREGKDFDVLFFPTALTAIKSGEVPLGPIQFKIQVAVPQRKQGANRNPLGAIFNGFPFVTQQNTFQEKIVILPEHRMRVNELPEEGKPASFRGAIGEFRFGAAFNQTRVKVGEPIVATLTVEGQGNFDRIEAPPLTAPEGWRVYPPEIHFAKADEFGLKGTKTFRIAVVPQTAKSHMPQFEFASFNPDAASYKTQVNDSFPLQIEGSPEKAMNETLSNSLRTKGLEPAVPKPDSQPEPGPPQALLETNLSSLGVSRLWSNQSLFWAVQGLLLSVISGVAVWKWNQRRVAALGLGPRLRREARELEASLPLQNSKPRWFNQARRAVQLLAAARSGHPAEAVDLEEALAALAPASQLAEDIRWLFETDAALRFGGQSVEEPPKTEDRLRIQSILRNIPQ